MLIDLSEGALQIVEDEYPNRLVVQGLGNRLIDGNLSPHLYTVDPGTLLPGGGPIRCGTFGAYQLPVQQPDTMTPYSDDPEDGDMNGLSTLRWEILARDTLGLGDSRVINREVQYRIYFRTLSWSFNGDVEMLRSLLTEMWFHPHEDDDVFRWVVLRSVYERPEDGQALWMTMLQNAFPVEVSLHNWDAFAARRPELWMPEQRHRPILMGTVEHYPISGGDLFESKAPPVDPAPRFERRDPFDPEDDPT